MPLSYQRPPAICGSQDGVGEKRTQINCVTCYSIPSAVELTQVNKSAATLTFPTPPPQRPISTKIGLIAQNCAGIAGGPGQSDRRLFGLLRSNRSCLRIRLGLSIPGETCRRSRLGTGFVLAVFPPAIVGKINAQPTAKTHTLFMRTSSNRRCAKAALAQTPAFAAAPLRTYSSHQSEAD